MQLDHCFYIYISNLSKNVLEEKDSVGFDHHFLRIKRRKWIKLRLIFLSTHDKEANNNSFKLPHVITATRMKAKRVTTKTNLR